MIAVVKGLLLTKLGVLVLNPWFIGAVFVAISAVHRFNEPRTPSRRSTTTFPRYSAGLACYLLIGLLCYYIAASTPALPKPPSNLPALWQAPPLYAALMISGLVPLVPGVKRIEEQIRAAIHRVAGITQVCDRLTDKLFSLTFGDNESTATEAQLYGVNETKTSWARIKELLAVFGKAAEFQDFRTRHDGEWDDTLVRSRLIDSTVNSVNADNVASVNDSIRPFARKFCNLVSRAVLEVGAGRSSRARLLKKLKIEDPEVAAAVARNVTGDQIVLVFLLTTLVSGMVLAARPGQQRISVLALALTIAIIQSIAVCWAVVGKAPAPLRRRELHEAPTDDAHWDRERKSTEAALPESGASVGQRLRNWVAWWKPYRECNRPWKDYVRRSGMSAISCIPMIILLHLAKHGLSETWIAFTYRWIWATVPFFTTMTLAFLCDTDGSTLQDAIFGFLSSAVAAIVVIYLMADNTHASHPLSFGRMVFRFLTVSATGTLLAILVPTWFRKATCPKNASRTDS